MRRLFKVRSCRMEFANVPREAGSPSGSSGHQKEMPSDSGRASENAANVRITNKAGRTPPCMDYYIGICPAPCLLKKETLEEHSNNVAKLEKFLL